MGTSPVAGLHHVTSVAGDPARNHRFFTEVLGLRFVKRTVNFDDPATYHLYYGNEVGEPGTAITFFPFVDGRPGRVGAGQVRTVQFHVPADSLDYWTERFDEHDVDHDAPESRLSERVLTFRDPDGLEYELVASDRATDVEPWDAVVPEPHAIRGFYGVALAVHDVGPTAELLELMGYERTVEAGRRTRYEADGGHATVVDLVDTGVQGRPGVGTVHHVAFRVPGDETQLAWQERLRDEGYQVTEQKDRRYFRSIYFRERNGVLFEFATQGPGFDRDEPVDALGTALTLPPWLEDDRQRIERQLPPLDVEEEASQ